MEVKVNIVDRPGYHYVLALAEAATQAREAFRLTREYVGDAMLPAIPGWSWYDADIALEKALYGLAKEVLHGTD